MQGRKTNLGLIIFMVIGGGVLLIIAISSLYSPTKSKNSFSVNAAKEKVSFVEPGKAFDKAEPANPYADLSPEELIAAATGVMKKAEHIMSEKKLQTKSLSSAERDNIKKTINELDKKIDTLNSNLK